MPSLSISQPGISTPSGGSPALLLPLCPWCSLSCCFTDYMAHLVEVQHERGASGGQTFHSLLTASLPPRRGTQPRPGGMGAPAPALPSLMPALLGWGPWRDGPCGHGPGGDWPGLTANTPSSCRQRRGAQTQKQPGAAPGPGQDPGHDPGAGSRPRGRPGQHVPAGVVPLPGLSAGVPAVPLLLPREGWPEAPLTPVPLCPPQSSRLSTGRLWVLVRCAWC